MDDEDVQFLVEAVTVLLQRNDAVEVAQQLLCMHLSSKQTQFANDAASTFQKISESEQVEADEHTRKYLSHLARMLRGDQDAPIWHLQKAPPPDKTEDKVSWLRGVIDGGKDGNA